MQQLYPREVFANTADFDTGIRQLLPRSDEMLEVITRCLLSPSRRILELASSRLMLLQQCHRSNF